MSVLAAPAFGDVRALRDDAVSLRGRARAAERLAHVVRRTDVGWWSGEAADGFGEALSATARRLLCAADDALAAARALERHADVVAWAQDEASGPIASPLEHEALLVDLRDAVRVSAEKAAATLRAIAESIERLPDGWDVAGYLRDQYWTGMGETLAGMVESSWQVQTFRFVTDPFGYVGEQRLIGQALHAGVRDDPVGLARAMVGWDTWRTEPVRAVGQQIPDLLLSAATAGAGGAAAGSRRAVSGLRPDLDVPEGATGVPAGLRRKPFSPISRAEEAGHTVEGQRTPGWVTPEGWAVPRWLAEAARRVPPEWGVAAPNKKGIGFRWFGERPSADGVRIDQGAPDAVWPTQTVHHVVVRKSGVVVGRDGRPVDGLQADPTAGHIPLDEWMTWTDWGTP